MFIGWTCKVHLGTPVFADIIKTTINQDLLNKYSMGGHKLASNGLAMDNRHHLVATHSVCDDSSSRTRLFNIHAVDVLILRANFRHVFFPFL